MSDLIGAKLAIERDGSQVSLTLELVDDYEAIRIYEELTRQAAGGLVSLAVEIGRRRE